MAKLVRKFRNSDIGIEVDVFHNRKSFTVVMHDIEARETVGARSFPTESAAYSYAARCMEAA